MKRDWTYTTALTPAQILDKLSGATKEWAPQAIWRAHDAYFIRRKSDTAVDVLLTGEVFGAIQTSLTLTATEEGTRITARNALPVGAMNCAALLIILGLVGTVLDLLRYGLSGLVRDVLFLLMGFVAGRETLRNMKRVEELEGFVKKTLSAPKRVSKETK